MGGLLLKRCREAAGLTQREVARRSGVPLGTLRNLEQDRKEPLFRTVVRIAETLGISLDALAGCGPSTSTEGKVSR